MNMTCERAPVTSLGAILKPSLVVQMWGEIEPLLARAVAHSSGELTTEDVLDAVENGRMFIAAVLDPTTRVLFAAACEIVVYPRVRALHVVLLAGRDLRAQQAHLGVLEQAARDMRCSRIQALCQAPAARLFRRVGFDPLYTMIAREVKP